MSVPQGQMPRPPNLTSPEMNSGPPSPERNSMLASPMADRLGGGLMQANSRLAMLVKMVRQGLQAISVMLRDSDPKAAAEVEQFAAKLLRLGATANVSPAAVGRMASAGGLPQSGPGSPPPSPGGMSMQPPLSGLGR